MTGKFGIHSLNKLFISEPAAAASTQDAEQVGPGDKIKSGKNGILWYYIFSTLVSQMAL